MLNCWPTRSASAFRRIGDCRRPAPPALPATVTAMPPAIAAWRLRGARPRSSRLKPAAPIGNATCAPLPRARWICCWRIYLGSCCRPGQPEARAGTHSHRRMLLTSLRALAKQSSLATIRLWIASSPTLLAMTEWDEEASSLLPERAHQLIVQRLDQIGQQRALAGLHESLDRHARYQFDIAQARDLRLRHRNADRIVRLSGALIGSGVGRDAGHDPVQFGRG